MGRWASPDQHLLLEEAERRARQQEQLIGMVLPAEKIGHGFLASLDFDLKTVWKGNPPSDLVDQVRSFLEARGIESYTLLMTGSGGLHAYFMTPRLLKFQPALIIKEGELPDCIHHVELRSGSAKHYNILYKDIAAEEGAFFRAHSPTLHEPHRAERRREQRESRPGMRLIPGGAGSLAELAATFGPGESNQYKLKHSRAARREGWELEAAFDDFMSRDRGSRLCKDRLEAVRAYREAWTGLNDKPGLLRLAGVEQEIQADIEINVEFLSMEEKRLAKEAESGRALIIQSPCGTGKTELGVRLRDHFRRQGVETEVLCHLRSNANSLEKRHEGKTTIHTFMQASEEGEAADAIRLRGEGALIIDEASLLSSAVCGGSFYKPARKIDLIRRIAGHRGPIILMDARLTKADLDIFRSITGRDLSVARNDFRREWGVEAQIADDDWMAKAAALVEAGERVFVAAGTEKQAELINRTFKHLAPGRRHIIATAKTRQADKTAREIADIEADPTSELADAASVVYSPTWCRGMDIKLEGHVFIVCDNHELSRVEYVQMALRCRRPQSLTFITYQKRRDAWNWTRQGKWWWQTLRSLQREGLLLGMERLPEKARPTRLAVLAAKLADQGDRDHRETLSEALAREGIGIEQEWESRGAIRVERNWREAQTVAGSSLALIQARRRPEELSRLLNTPLITEREADRIDSIQHELRETGETDALEVVRDLQAAQGPQHLEAHLARGKDRATRLKRRQKFDRHFGSRRSRVELPDSRKADAERRVAARVINSVQQAWADAGLIEQASIVTDSQSLPYKWEALLLLDEMTIEKARVACRIVMGYKVELARHCGIRGLEGSWGLMIQEAEEWEAENGLIEEEGNWSSKPARRKYNVWNRIMTWTIREIWGVAREPDQAWRPGPRTYYISRKDIEGLRHEIAGGYEHDVFLAENAAAGRPLSRIDTVHAAAAARGGWEERKSKAVRQLLRLEAAEESKSIRRQVDESEIGRLRAERLQKAYSNIDAEMADWRGEDAKRSRDLHEERRKWHYRKLGREKLEQQRMERKEKAVNKIRATFRIKAEEDRREETRERRQGQALLSQAESQADKTAAEEMLIEIRKEYRNRAEERAAEREMQIARAKERHLRRWQWQDRNRWEWWGEIEAAMKRRLEREIEEHRECLREIRKDLMKEARKRIAETEPGKMHAAMLRGELNRAKMKRKEERTERLKENRRRCKEEWRETDELPREHRTYTRETPLPCGIEADAKALRAETKVENSICGEREEGSDRCCYADLWRSPESYFVIEREEIKEIREGSWQPSIDFDRVWRERMKTLGIRYEESEAPIPTIEARGDPPDLRDTG